MSRGMGFEVSKVFVSVSVSVSLLQGRGRGSDVNSQLLLQHGASLPLATLPTVITDSPSETVSKPPVRCSLLYVALVMASLHSRRTVTGTTLK